MTFKKGTANIPVGTNPNIQRDPERVPQEPEPLNYDQALIQHVMMCREVGCLRCSA